MEPSSVATSADGTGYESTRSSEQVSCPQRDVPTIIDKMTSLLNCTAGQLEMLQIIRYTKGQYFKPHIDGQHGPWSNVGFVDAGRLATIFVYLLDVPNGGETKFIGVGSPSEGDVVAYLSSFGTVSEGTISKANADGTFDITYTDAEGREGIEASIKAEHVGTKSPGRTLSVRPKKGMAVVHFPQTTSLELDVRTMHEGATAIDEKWILATWMCVVDLVVVTDNLPDLGMICVCTCGAWRHRWSKIREDATYADDLYPSLTMADGEKVDMI